MEFKKKLIHPLASLGEALAFIYLYMEVRGEIEYNDLQEIFNRHFQTNLTFEIIRNIVTKFDHFSKN